MTFCYLRDSIGQAIITIAYEIKEDECYYGLSIVSGSEPIIDKNRGKNIATSRCREAINGSVINWNTYYIGGEESDSSRNFFISLMKSYGFSKLGKMESNYFKDIVKNLSYVNRKFPLEQDEAIFGTDFIYNDLETMKSFYEQNESK